jgi:predicted RNase H-like nuclease (RuvC/YqgF family)
MFDFEAIVVEIERKVRKLAGENQRLRLEVEKANDRCKQLQEQLDNQNIVINNLKEQNNKLKLGNTLTQKGDSVEIRLKINQLIRSIDKSLALINKSPEE